MNIKIVPEKASGEPRLDCALLLLFQPENNGYFNWSCQSNTQLVIPSVIQTYLVFFSFKLSQFLDENISKNSTFFAGCFLAKNSIGFVISRKCLIYNTERESYLAGKHPAMIHTAASIFYLSFSLNDYLWGFEVLL